MIGNGLCDDLMNNAECDYDGGDCCGNNVTYGNCSQCACLNPAVASLKLVANIASKCPKNFKILYVDTYYTTKFKSYIFRLPRVGCKECVNAVERMIECYQ